MAWPEVTLANALAWTLGGIKWIAVLAVVGVAAGFAYASLATPKFTASTDLVIAPANLQVVNNDIYPTTTDQNARLLDVESKLRVLTSGNVLSRVVDELSLATDPEFTRPSGLELPFIGGGAVPLDPRQTAIDALGKRVSASREERSYVVTLSVSTEDAQKSVTIADAIVAAFQAELARAESDGAARVAQSLNDRLATLRAGVAAAEAAVATFRRDHGLEQTNGELVNAQAMSLLNQRVVDAQQALIAAQSRYAGLTDPAIGVANADAVQTPTMVALRTQYGLLKQQADAAATMYGPLHPTRVTAERQLRGLAQQIAAEAARAVQTAALDVAQAERTVADLTTETQAARTTVADDGQSQVALNELERDAKAQSDVYEAFLARAREMTERTQLDTTNVRTITPATPPGTRSWPPRGVVVGGLGGFGGLALGIVLALGLGFLAEARRPRQAD
jgi:uncharacterized protein involved in exopolysaccharide biosynthesis